MTRLDSLLSVYSENETNKVVELSERAQKLTGLAYLCMICATACAVDDLTLVFGFLSGISECLITFILPSIFYFTALKHERSQGYQKKPPTSNFGEKLAVGLFFLVGVAYFCLSNYFNIVKIVRAL